MTTTVWEQPVAGTAHRVQPHIRVVVAGRYECRVLEAAQSCQASGSRSLDNRNTLGPLAADDDNSSRLCDTLRVVLQQNGSFKATAERLSLHKNTVQYRVRKAEESLGRPVDESRLNVELALLASQWLAATVLGRPGELPP